MEEYVGGSIVSKCRQNQTTKGLENKDKFVDKLTGNGIKESVRMCSSGRKKWLAGFILRFGGTLEVLKRVWNITKVRMSDDKDGQVR